MIQYFHLVLLCWGRRWLWWGGFVCGHHSPDGGSMVHCQKEGWVVSLLELLCTAPPGKHGWNQSIAAMLVEEPISHFGNLSFISPPVRNSSSGVEQSAENRGEGEELEARSSFHQSFIGISFISACLRLCAQRHLDPNNNQPVTEGLKFGSMKFHSHASLAVTRQRFLCTGCSQRAVSFLKKILKSKF